MSVYYVCIVNLGPRQQDPSLSQVLLDFWKLPSHDSKGEKMVNSSPAERIVNDDLESGRLVNLFPEYEATAADFNTAVWLLYTSRAYLPGKTRAFIDFLKENKW